MGIPKTEFFKRKDRLQAYLKEKNLGAIAVYGDEYRKENLRYVSDFWPIFERGMCFIPQVGEPILAGAPEGEVYAREMSVWEDVRNVKEFLCVTVPDEIEYPLAVFSNFQEILHEVLNGHKRLGLVGYWDIPTPIMERLKSSIPGLEIIEVDEILQKMRLIKSAAEIECLKECGRIACLGYEEIMKNAVPGNTERMAAGSGEGAARVAGAEDINFHVFGSGERTNTIIGRPTEKIIRDGDMIMSSMAVQYEGYVITVEFPFVAGKTRDDQKRMLEVLFEAANVQQEYLKAGIVTGEMVKAVKNVFRKYDMQKYDVYPPMHGIGLAEAESPYPDENSVYPFEAGMCVNSDISLFGYSGGSNRIEEGFLISDGGCESLTPYIRTKIQSKYFN
jgi:Xaa-Pro aminopeptidase